MSQFGMLNNQDLYTGDIADALRASANSSFCPYIQADSIVSTCNGYLGGIAESGLPTTINLLVQLQNEYIARVVEIFRSIWYNSKYFVRPLFLRF